MIDIGTIIRLFVSQAFALLFFLILIPLKKPGKRSLILLISGVALITAVNAVLIILYGIEAYTKFYFVSLVIPYIILFSVFSRFKGAKLLFALLSTEVIINLSIINGLLASYIFFKENNPYIDTVARVITYLICLPIVLKLMSPIYKKMAISLDKGWWNLNFAMILLYLLSYAILFYPTNIFLRPIYFIHAYVIIVLPFMIYVIIFNLLIQIQDKMDIEKAKRELSKEVSNLEAESKFISTIANKDTLTGINNRYSLFRQLDLLIDTKQKFLLLFIDLDNLKQINDNYSHSKGDEYLRIFAMALKDVISDRGEVFRFAGDEFVCLIHNGCSDFDQQVFKDKVESHINWDLPFLGFSIGVSCYPIDGHDSDKLISIADEKMYKEKKSKNIRR